jgi:type II secretory pathway pseudopilin PulG
MRKNIQSKRSRPRRTEEGYVLLYLMFLVALLALALVTALPALKFERQRDQEEEMVHRGVQYTRAIRRYFRKMGGYPPSLDVLESSNNIRFLRKRYKDPITGKDFKILHQVDVKFTSGNGIIGAQTLGQPIGGVATSSSPTDPSQDPNAANNSASGGQATSGSDSNASGSSPSPNSGTTMPFTTINGQPAGLTAGGGAIVGVASTSKKETIRIYSKKNHYNDWQFVYDPSTDRGALIVGPYQPLLQSVFQGQGQQGQGQFGQPGNSNGFGLNPSLPGSAPGTSPPQ